MSPRQLRLSPARPRREPSSNGIGRLAFRPLVTTLVAVSVVLLSGSLAGCVSRNVEKIDREEASDLPPPPEGAVAGVSPEAGIDPGAARSDGAAPAAEVPAIRGSVEIDDGLASRVPEGATLFLIVRVAGREGGPPLAVQRPAGWRLPHEFVITEADAMVPGTPLMGELSVEARIDQDGVATTRTPGDLHGRVEPVTADAEEPVRIVVDGRVEGS